MKKLLTINNPFQTVDEFHQRAGKQLGSLIHRLAGKYPQLTQRCGTRRMLLALSVAWALTSLAKAGDREAFEHIDEALSPPTVCGSVTAPSWGCVMVEGDGFIARKDSLVAADALEPVCKKVAGRLRNDAEE